MGLWVTGSGSVSCVPNQHLLREKNFKNRSVLYCGICDLSKIQGIIMADIVS